MKNLYKILPYLVILGMAVFMYFQFTENQDLKGLQEDWELREKKYIQEQQDLEFENEEHLGVIDILKEDRVQLKDELDSIQKIRKNETPIPTYKPVGDDKLLDSILHYARK